MILDNIKNSDLYNSIHPLFKTAFDFLKRTDVNTLDPGKHEIEGDNLFVIVSKGEVIPPEIIKLESHKKYIDIQFAVKGEDTIGWKQVLKCENPLGEFNIKDDYILYEEEPKFKFIIPENHFAILYPDDAHAPMIGNVFLHKLVVKVKI